MRCLSSSAPGRRASGCPRPSCAIDKGFVLTGRELMADEPSRGCGKNGGIHCRWRRARQASLPRATSARRHEPRRLGRWRRLDGGPVRPRISGDGLSYSASASVSAKPLSTHCPVVRKPARASVGARSSRAVLVGAFRPDRLARLECDVQVGRRHPHPLPLGAHQVHLHARLAAFQMRAMDELREVEIGAQFPVHAHEQVAVEGGGHAERIVVRRAADRLGLHRDRCRAAGRRRRAARRGCRAAARRHRRIEIADVRAEKQHQRRPTRARAARSRRRPSS